VSEPISESVVRSPAPALRPYIDEYIGYRLLGHESGVHRGLPSGHLTFIVSIGPTIDTIAQTDPQQSPERYRFVLGGLAASHALIAHDGNQEGVAIALTPVGSRALLGLPAGALWNTSVEAAEIMGGTGRELWERLQATTGWAARFAVCDEILLRALRANVGVADELREAWRLISVSHGSVPIADLAGEIGWSRRHLALRFGDEFGLSPKTAARVVRFARARHLLRSAERPALAEVAAACGYYDQPHLNRDFVELAGCPPGEWLAAEDLPSVQDDDQAESAGSRT
jgi:AraC-like DNA-binding protein